MARRNIVLFLVLPLLFLGTLYTVPFRQIDAAPAAEPVHMSDSQASASLLRACMTGEYEKAAYALSQNAWAGYRDSAPLRWAAFLGHTEIVVLLLEHGADVHALSDAAVKHASENGHKEVVQILLDAGANPKAVAAAVIENAEQPEM